jgi:hypothetical protein
MEFSHSSSFSSYLETKSSRHIPSALMHASGIELVQVIDPKVVPGFKGISFPLHATPHANLKI